MKIRDKRSAYFYILGPSGPDVKTRFSYLDEIPGGVENALRHHFTITEGEEIEGLIVKKIDAGRPFVLFSGSPYGSAPGCTAASSQGATYTNTDTAAGTSGDGSEGAVFPGLKCGDFVKITLS